MVFTRAQKEITYKLRVEQNHSWKKIAMKFIKSHGITRKEAVNNSPRFVTLTDTVRHMGNKEIERMRNIMQLVEVSEQFVVEEIIKSRKTLRGTEYFVKWMNWTADYNEWKTERELSDCKILIHKYEQELL